MNRRSNWEDFKNILEQNHITKLYHFTDRDNLENIIKNGGLYSWKDCEERGINIPKPGGGGPGSPSWSLDKRDNLEHYVRVSFTMNHPMMYVAMNEDRISNPVILEIDPEVIYDENTKYADRNAVRMVLMWVEVWRISRRFTSKLSRLAITSISMWMSSLSIRRRYW